MAAAADFADAGGAAAAHAVEHQAQARRQPQDAAREREAPLREGDRGTVPSTCTGRITLPGGKKGRKAFSSRSFTVASQKTATIRLTLTRKAISFLRKGQVEAKLRATVANPGAASRKASWPVRVRLAKKR